MPDNGFAKAYHLRNGTEFKTVFRGGRKIITGTLVFHVLRTDAKQSRLGLAVSRRVGNAVVRNKVKRRIREVFRRKKNEFRRGYDIVVYPRKGVLEKTFEDYIHSFDILERKIEGRNKNKRANRGT